MDVDSSASSKTYLKSMKRRPYRPPDIVPGMLLEMKHHAPVLGLVWGILDESFGIERLSSDCYDRRFQIINRELFFLPILMVFGLGALALAVFDAIRRPYLERIQAASRAMRRKLRRSRRKSTRNPPTPQAIEAAWEKAHKSLEWRLRLGSMLADLELVVDQSYIRDANGTIVGRKAGIRGWLRENCPVVSRHYKTAMGYKAIANRFRLAVGLREPFTLEDVLDGFDIQEQLFRNTRKPNKKDDKNFKNSVKPKAESEDVEGVRMKPGGCTGVLKAECERARKVLEALQRQNHVRGRPMRRSLSALDGLLHSQLQLLNAPRCA